MRNVAIPQVLNPSEGTSTNEMGSKCKMVVALLCP